MMKKGEGVAAKMHALLETVTIHKHNPNAQCVAAILVICA